MYNLFIHEAQRSSQELLEKCPCIPGSNWNLKRLVFEERGEPEYPEKNLSEQRREPKTNPAHIWRRVRETNPGNTAKRALPPLRHPCSQCFSLVLCISASWIPYYLYDRCKRKVQRLFESYTNTSPAIIAIVDTTNHWDTLKFCLDDRSDQML